jgi:Epoxide hydrolase N terminus
MPESAFLPEPFTLQASPEALTDLRARLRATRWPDAPENAGWSLGTDLAYLRDLVTYWADGFDWAAQEKALSGSPHGGAFAPLEEPEFYAEELRAFFRPYRL